jgi:hypothetical protein
MPGGVVTTLPPGAGDGEGDASFQGPAQEDTQAQIEALPAQPKPANSEPAAADQSGSADNEPGAVIALAARMEKADAARVSAAPAGRGGLVTVQPKPAKRKNARERAREKYAKGSNGSLGSAGESAEDGTTPVMTATAKYKADAKAEAKAEFKAKAKATKAAKKLERKAAKETKEAIKKEKRKAKKAAA